MQLPRGFGSISAAPAGEELGAAIAAGNAAALCVRDAATPREVEVARLRTMLAGQGVALTAG